MRTFSFGGGVQSTAVLVLAARGEIHYDTFLFANVGDDAESPDTLAYVADVARPYAEAHGLNLVELAGHSLYQRLLTSERSIGIPIRMDGGAPGHRNCTTDFKIKPIGRWLKARGATVENPATVGLGISIDEVHRARFGVDPRSPYERREYPLIDRNLTRLDCRHIILAAGLPEPPKSSCWFCPFHSLPAWRQLDRRHPELFEQAVALEQTLSDRSVALGRRPVWLTRTERPLRDVIQDGQLSLDDLSCDEGYCDV